MSVYVLGLSAVHNQEEMNRYRQGVPGTLSQYGGRLAVRGLVSDVFEGNVQADSVVVFEFDSAEDARRWYTSPEYSAVRRHRLDGADTSVLLVSPPRGYPERPDPRSQR